MKWRALRVRLRPQAPVRIGWHRLGLIERTRYWIPATSFWGAAVQTAVWNGVAGAEWGKNKADTPYARLEKEWQQDSRFLPLFPVVEGVMRRPCLTPDHGLVYAPSRAAQQKDMLTPFVMEKKLVQGFAAAAIAPATFTALDGALHEAEYLASRGLEFEGYILTASPEKNACYWQRALEGFAVGADRTYGWGRMRVGVEAWSGALYEEFKVAGREAAVVGTKVKAAMPAYVKLAAAEGILDGQLEPIVGRFTNERGPGRGVSKAEWCYAPGSTIGDRAPGQETEFAITPNGIWHVAVEGAGQARPIG